MAKKGQGSSPAATTTSPAPRTGKPSSLLDTRVIYCGLRRAQSSRDNLEQLAKPALSLSNGLPDHCVDLIYIDPPFNSNRNYEVFWGETKETSL